MTLKFDKNQNGDVIAMIMDGVNNHPFSYIHLIKSLMNKEIVQADYSDLIKDEEKKQIELLLKEINNVVFPSPDKVEPSLF